MKTPSLTALSSFFVVAALAVHADEGLPPNCHCEKGYYEKTVTAFKPVCKEVQVPAVVKKCYYRDEMRPVKTVVMVPRDFVEKRPRTITVPEEKIVTKCRKVPVTLVDPDTGCAIITYKNECYPEKVICPVEKVILEDVKVCRRVPEERVVMQPFKVKDYRDETVMLTRMQCEMVPYTKVIRVPCPPPGPNYRQVVPLGAPPRPLPPAGSYAPPPPSTPPPPAIPAPKAPY